MLKRQTINRVEPVSAGKVMGITQGVSGIFAGLFFGASLALGASVGPQGPGLGMGTGLIVGGIFVILAPIVFGVMGFISGMFMAVIYNLVSEYIGGLVLEVDDESEDDDD